jgi:hypothetical protein
MSVDISAVIDTLATIKVNLSPQNAGSSRTATAATSPAGRLHHFLEQHAPDLAEESRLRQATRLLAEASQLADLAYCSQQLGAMRDHLMAADQQLPDAPEATKAAFMALIMMAESGRLSAEDRLKLLRAVGQLTARQLTILRYLAGHAGTITDARLATDLNFPVAALPTEASTLAGLGLVEDRGPTSRIWVYDHTIVRQALELNAWLERFE